MTSPTRCSANKCSGATDKGFVTGVGDDNKSLTTLDSGRRETLIAFAFLDCERFTGKSGLIDLEIGILGDNLAISWNNGTLETCLVFVLHCANHKDIPLRPEECHQARLEEPRVP